MRARFIVWAGLLATIVVLLVPAISLGPVMTIYVIDVEGGNATLFSMPDGASVLIDSGNGGPAATRDADRIMAAVRDAGLTRIDHLITTHWHSDHYGGLAALAARLPIAELIDHGDTVQPDPQVDQFVATVYQPLLARASHVVATPETVLRFGPVEWNIATSAGRVTAPRHNLDRLNPACQSSAPMATDASENAQSVGSVVRLLDFGVAHMGDLTWNKELELMCPRPRLDTVDLLIVSHHGLAVSNSPALVHGLAPAVAIVNNSATKGAAIATMKTLRHSPGLEDIWLVHGSTVSDEALPVADRFIANQPRPSGTAHNGAAAWIKVVAQANGDFTVTNGRNGFSKHYQATASRR